jgi:hypothetical protein
MELLIGGGLAAVAGTSAIGTVVSRVVCSTGTLLNFLWYGSETNIQLRTYHRRILQLDIQDKVKYVNDILEMPLPPPSIRFMETGLRKITGDILQSLQTIQQRIEEHNTKWFASYRNIALDEEIKDLETLVSILDKKTALITISAASGI